MQCTGRMPFCAYANMMHCEITFLCVDSHSGIKIVSFSTKIRLDNVKNGEKSLKMRVNWLILLCQVAILHLDRRKTVSLRHFCRCCAAH